MKMGHLQAVCAERENQVASASTGSAEEIHALQERLRASEEKVRPSKPSQC